MIMKRTVVYNSFFLCLVITFNSLTPLKALAIEHRESRSIPKDDFNQYLSQPNDESTEDDSKSDDILMQNVLRILFDLQKPDTAILPEKKQPSTDPKNNFLVNRRFAMGTFNNKLFGVYDREAVESLKHTLFGKVNVKEGECMSFFIKNFIKNIEDLRWAENFCRERS